MRKGEEREGRQRYGGARHMRIMGIMGPLGRASPMILMTGGRFMGMMGSMGSMGMMRAVGRASPMILIIPMTPIPMLPIRPSDSRAFPQSHAVSSP
jgi:hypothetical protein